MNPQQRAALKAKVEEAKKSPPAAKPKASPELDKVLRILTTLEPSKPAVPEKVKLGKIKHACGHESSLDDYASQPCGPCRQEGRRKKAEKKRLKLEAAGKVYGVSRKECGRLPDSARYEKTYDAQAQAWTATLTVEVGGVERIFIATASGSYKVEKLLDNQFRDAVAALEAPQPPAEPTS